MLPGRQRPALPASPNRACGILLGRALARKTYGPAPTPQRRTRLLARRRPASAGGQLLTCQKHPSDVNSILEQIDREGWHIYARGGTSCSCGDGQVGKSWIFTPRASAMRDRSPGSLVTTGAWWRTAVAMTIASTTSAVAEAAQAIPAARPMYSSSGMMSQPLSTREIWCWGPPRQAWARTTTGTSRSEEHTSELQSRQYLVCRLL